MDLAARRVSIARYSSMERKMNGILVVGGKKKRTYRSPPRDRPNNDVSAHTESVSLCGIRAVSFPQTGRFLATRELGLKMMMVVEGERHRMWDSGCEVPCGRRAGS
jgi:hypothetical protein